MEECHEYCNFEAATTSIGNDLPTPKGYQGQESCQVMSLQTWSSIPPASWHDTDMYFYIPFIYSNTSTSGFTFDYALCRSTPTPPADHNGHVVINFQLTVFITSIKLQICRSNRPLQHVKQNLMLNVKLNKVLISLSSMWLTFILLRRTLGRGRCWGFKMLLASLEHDWLDCECGTW